MSDTNCPAYSGPHYSLRARVRIHDWSAPPDAAYTLSLRIALLRDLAELPLPDLAALLRSLQDEVLAARILQQTKEISR